MEPITISLIVSGVLSLFGTGLSIFGQSQANKAAAAAAEADLKALTATTRAERLKADAQFLSAVEQNRLQMALDAQQAATTAARNARIIQNSLFLATALLLGLTAVVLAIRAAKPGVRK